MEIVLLLLPLALAGAALGRWTRWRPLTIAPALGLLPGALGLLATAGFLAEGGAILLFGGFAFVVGTWAAGMGAFAGRLRRRHVERMG